MARLNIAIWPGSGSFFPGDTPFGIYDTDSTFQSDADKVADFAAQKLGYPITDIEMQANQFFACFEEATTEYGAQVNQFRIRETMLDVKGYSTGSSFTGKEITPTLGPQIAIAENYGTEAGSGGNVAYKSGSVTLVPNQQDYDLQNLWANVSESNQRIVVTKVHFEATPAITRFFDPYVGTGAGSQGMLDGFGWGNYSPGINFLLMPVFADVLRMQAIEFNDMVRRSQYSFELVNNQLKIFPIPKYGNGSGDHKLWFEYIKKSERNNPYQDGINKITNVSEVPFTNPNYNQINSIGRQWIFEYALAIAKEMLGYIRGKYQSLPIPGETTTLDYTRLLSEASAEKTSLIEELQKLLEETTRLKQLERKNQEAQQTQETYYKVPYHIYVG